MKLFIILSLSIFLLSTSACEKQLGLPAYIEPLPAFTIKALTDSSTKTWQPYRVHVSDAVKALYVTNEKDSLIYWKIYQVYVDSTNMANYKISYSIGNINDGGFYEATDTVTKHLQIPKTGNFHLINKGEQVGFSKKVWLSKEKRLSEILGGLVVISGYTDTITGTRHTTTLYYH